MVDDITGAMVLSFHVFKAIMLIFETGGLSLKETNPVIPFRASGGKAEVSTNRHEAPPPFTAFNRRELNIILDLYGRRVADGEWRDYAIDMGKDKATFSIFRKTSECPLLRIEKVPKLARKQGAYAVVAATGLILKRGQDLRTVLRVLEKSVRLVQQ